MLVPPRVLGRRLHPFTLGHAHLLETAKSPFMGIGSGKVDSADLILAAWICSFPRYGKARAAAIAAMRGRVPRSVRRWGRKIGMEFDLKKEAERLAKWIYDSTKAPPTLKNTAAKALATPGAATLAVLHRHYFGTSADRICDVPFLDALLDVLVWHHAQGKIKIIDEAKAEWIEKVSNLKPPRPVFQKKAPRK